ncbi:MAG: O-antigen ligase family protein [Solirubrobacterales bacterium]|nr:O-antigen ligase family protein [Solirubrobacterales bacterium]
MLAVTIVALAVGALTVVQPGAAAAFSGALCLAAVVSSMRTHAQPTALAKNFRWVSFAWAFVLLEPVGHFSTGRTVLTAVAGVPSVENVIELSVYGVIAAFAVGSLWRNRFGRRPSWVMLALPAFALLSAAWSLATTVTLGFSFELVAIVLLATVTAAILTADATLGRSLVRRTLRVQVQGVAVLCVVGLIFQNSWTAAGEPARFTWPGTHPLVAGAEVGVAVLVLVFAGRDAGFLWPSRTALLAMFAVCLYLGQARTALAGLAVSGLFGYWFVSKGTGPGRRLAGAAAIAVTVFVVVTSFGGPLTQYLYRGQSQQQVFGLNGRLGLWTFALGQIHAPGRWLVGYGLSGSRVLFASSVPWAGDAHSAWLELLLSLGLIGVALATWLVVTLAVRLLRTVPEAPLPSNVLPILFVYVLAMSPVATGFAAPGPEPGLGFGLLGLCYAATVARKRATARALAARPLPLATDLQPAPT